jgi:pimeloyl-ACP methyl ester carboxylesterase
MIKEIRKKLPETDTGKKPLLFIHGAWHGAWCWDKYSLPYFAEKGYPAYALSLSNHGESEGRKRLNFTFISDYVKDVEETIAEMDEKPILIGHSMGGLVVQKFLENGSVPAAILLAPIPPSGALRLTLKIARTHFKVFLLANLTWNLYRIIGTKKLAKTLLFSENMEAENVSEYFEQLQSESYLAYLLGMIFPRIKHKKQAKIPMLVLGAEKDEIFTEKEVEETAKAYNAESQIFPNMAHDMMLEAGWQDAADRIIQFLENLK